MSKTSNYRKSEVGLAHQAALDSTAKKRTEISHYIRKLKAKQASEPKVPEDLQGLQHTLVVLQAEQRRQLPKRRLEARRAKLEHRARPRVGQRGEPLRATAFNIPTTRRHASRLATFEERFPKSAL